MGITAATDHLELYILALCLDSPFKKLALCSAAACFHRDTNVSLYSVTFCVFDIAQRRLVAILYSSQRHNCIRA